ncbi:patatin-like phospholipase family protein [Devosia sp.]|uniref:patatin-like phospholipase family protein n=1 Tax=Devosia sp. TaxID=1871048 RepID=UPI003F6FD007
MTHKDLALVLGGGGAAGNAWMIGIVAGLAEAGVDLTELADLVIGTSAGANAAAQVRSGISPAELLAATLAPPPGQPAAPPRPPSPPRPMEAVFEQMRNISAAASTQLELQRAMAAYALRSDMSFAPEVAEQRRALVARRLPRPDWPERPMLIVAVNAETGELATFDRQSGVALVDAATAAISLPGAGPTHSINGTRYISGGVRSVDNADLATGFGTVIVLSPFSGRTGPLPPGQFEGLRRPPGADLASEVEALRRAGSHVEVITPDADSRAAMGVNQMDLATRIPSARAGCEQGKREAARLTAL